MVNFVTQVKIKNLYIRDDFSLWNLGYLVFLILWRSLYLLVLWMPGICDVVLTTVVQHSDLFSINILYINSDGAKWQQKRSVSVCGLLACLRKYRVYLHRLLTTGKGCCLHIAGSVFLPVFIGWHFHLLVPEVSVLQPQQLKHPGATHLALSDVFISCTKELIFFLVDWEFSSHILVFIK